MTVHDDDRVQIVRDLVYPKGIAPEVIDNAPFMPIKGNNDGKVRDKNGRIVADTGGHEGMAETIALLFNEEAAKARERLLSKLEGNDTARQEEKV